ncbi:inositol hexakisphosphate kinase 2-like [Latimeria chalumnae]|uniref:Kinase n=1 Tax=Latimeria chalumnae TaxID=7897 RepID=H3ABR7_LATCH|nr:PREDICTED: inositol hexakisphosphate kinase 2-like [Latimeria chalumnae]XP_006010214.1 PREDICTED: inositol hexakisphosphate kinase 2-like [Latimeria chalumnae]XP_014352673.1 PREDICTED: inositol hexakisphosphate kinase 2-like [Latimeria chalumnae]|eukprot:XP_006010213.1 PREDICTED: inositol hexakisphosphate kinase 2-like [Latimeria chalumnae]
MGPALQNLMVKPRPQGVTLQPFVHQVGGHSCILRFNERTVCKPHISQEHQFYKSLLPELQKFTPEYRGVVLVNLSEDDRGEATLVAYNLGASRISAESLCCPNQVARLYQQRSQELAVSDGQEKENLHPSSLRLKEHVGQRQDEKFDSLKQPFVLRLPLCDPTGSGRYEAYPNPWSKKCHQRAIELMKGNSKPGNQYKFLLLEDITAGYNYPCILDLKMGTRQYGDNASEEKKRSQTQKCQQSTSATLGIRVCGMQVFQLQAERMVFMNKYYGRNLSPASLREAIFQFFHGGRNLYCAVIRCVLQRLSELKAVIRRLESYRFFSSSLLIIYDGNAPAASCLQHCEGETSGGSSEPGQPPLTVDVRMIDFAHMTCRGFVENGVTYEGCDAGFLFGLENLIEILNSTLGSEAEAGLRAATL